MSITTTHKRGSRGSSSAARDRQHIIQDTLKRIPKSVAGPATQLDANGTVLDVNAIVDGEVLKRVGATVVSVPLGAPGLHAASHQNGGADEVNVAGLSGLLADAQTPLAHVLATIAGLGPEHTVSGLTARQVLIATGAATALFRALVAADIPAEFIIDTELATELLNYPDFVDFNDHSARHEPGGADELTGFVKDTGDTVTGPLDVADPVGSSPMRIRHNAAPLDAKRWWFQVLSDGTLRIRAVNDAETSGNNAIVITRAGDVPATISLGTLVLPRANGGTGLAAAGVLGNVLTSNGTDWASSPLPAALITDTELAAELANYADIDHSIDHENGGIDEINVAGLSGLLADEQTPLIHDIITKHNGFPGGTANFLRADGTFAAPPGGASSDPVQQSYAPGSFTVPTGKYTMHSRRLQFTGAQRLTLQGTAHARIF